MSERELIGRAPIPPLFLGVAKASFAVSWAFPAFDLLGWVTPAGELPVVRVAGVLVMLLGGCIAVAAMADLGNSLALGLPGIPPGLRTGGLYRFSRNPVFLGALVTCAGSCLVVPHMLNLLCFLFAILLHVWIVRREESYLEAAYGDAWRSYARRVPRWAGLRRTPDAR